MEINEVIASTWESVLFLGFMRYFYGGKHQGIRKIATFALAMCLLIINILIADSMNNYEPWVIVGDIVIIISYSYLELNGKWYEHIAGFILYYVGMFGRVSVAVFLIDMAGKNGIISWTNTNHPDRGIFLCMAGILLFLYVLLIIRLKKHIIFLFKNWYILINIVIPVITLFLLLNLANIVMHENISYKSKISILVMVILMIILLIALFCYAANGIRSEAQKQKNSALLQMIKIETDAYQKLYDSRNEVIRFKHDIINKMLAIQYLVDEERIIKAGQELKKIIEDMSGEKRRLVKSKHLWDLIIDSRVEHLVELDIRIEKNIYPGNYQCINEMDMALMIGNLFDNAVEAQDKVPRELRHIYFNMKENWGCIYIEMRNSARGELDNILLETTKEDKAFHGWGFRSVHEIVKKYNGTIITNILEKEFVIELLLYFE